MSLFIALVLTAWPAEDAVLKSLPFPKIQKKKIRVYLDAGHGAQGNEGNHGCFCQLEEVHTLRVVMHLAQSLKKLGSFEVMHSRDGVSKPSYRVRLAEAEAFGAEFIVSVHSDARGWAVPWGTGDDGRDCWRNDDAPGFAVLWNTEGTHRVVTGRERLGRSIGQRLRQAGFLAYSGEDYGALYRQDDEEPSGWIDIRPRKKSVYFLRGSSIPTVIVETHHALDPQEVFRWDQPSTLDAFASAIAQALLDARN